MSELGPTTAVRLLIAGWPANAPRGAVTVFCAEHQVSTSWFYKVRAIAQAEGPNAAVRKNATVPKVSPQQIDHVMTALLLQTRAELKAAGWDYGPLSVIAALRRAGITAPSRATIARLFTAAGVVRPQPRKRPRSSYQRFVYPAPNACWQIDAMEWSLADGTKVVIFQVIDDHSRLAIASLVAAGETAAAAVEVVTIGIDRHGVPERVLSDNGVALNPTRRGATGQLVVFLLSLGVEPITGKPYKPTTQGKNERSHQTIQRYLRAHPAATTIDELQTLVDRYDEHYNNHRENQALPDRMTPAEAYTALPHTTAPTPPARARARAIVIGRTPATAAAPTSVPAAPPADPTAVQLTIRVADVTGAVGIAGSRYLIGREHARASIHILHDANTVAFFTADGTHLRTDPRAPAGSYVRNNLPKTRRPERPSTKP